MYVENSKRLISNYNYHDEPLNNIYQREYWNFILEGGHDYSWYFFVEGPQGTYLNIRIEFETMDNITYTFSTEAENTWLRFWGKYSAYTDPLYIDANETIFIDVQLTTDTTSSGIHWQMRIYQDLPMWLTRPVNIVTLFTFILLVIWAISFEQYEKIFDDIKKQQKKFDKITKEDLANGK